MTLLIGIIRRVVSSMGTKENSEVIKNFSEVLRNIVFALAAASSAIWAIYVFSEKRESIMAEAHLAVEKLHSEEIRRSLTRDASRIKFEITKACEYADADSITVAVNIRITSSGIRAFVIRPARNSIRIARIQGLISEENHHVPNFVERQFTTFYGMSRKDPETEFSALSKYTIVPDTEITLQSFFKVKQPGLYFIEIQCDFEVATTKAAEKPGTKIEDTRSIPAKTSSSDWAYGSAVLQINRP